MRQEEAKNKIFELWFQEPLDKRTQTDAFIFALKLRKEKPYLVSFRCSGNDPLQQIMAWLIPYIEKKKR